MAWFPSIYLLVRVFGMPFRSYPHISRWLKEMEQKPAFVKGVKPYMKPIPFWILRLIMRVIRLTGERK